MPDHAGVGAEVTLAPWYVDPIEDPATTSRPCGCGFHPGTPMECFATIYPDETPEYLAYMVRSDERWWASQAVPQPKYVPTPRTYKPSSHWRALRDKAQAELDRLTGSTPNDPAVVNLSHTSRSRAARNAGKRRMAKLGRDTEKVARLMRRIEGLDHKVLMSEYRERK